MNHVHDSRQSSRFPYMNQLVLQVLIFFAVGQAFENLILHFIHIHPGNSNSNCKPRGLFEDTSKEEASRDYAADLVMDFVKPRGTLLLAIALLGMSTPLNRYTGPPHPMAMVLWTVLDQTGRI